MTTKPAARKEEVLERIKAILKDRLGVTAAIIDSCEPDTPLVGRGVGLDSVETMSLAAGIEDAFDIQFDDDELTPELFANLGALARQVVHKCGEKP